MRGPFDALDVPGVPEARSMDPDANEPMAPTEQGSTTFAPPSSSAGQAPALPPPLDPPVPSTLGGNKRPSSTGLALTEDLYLHDLGTNVAALTTKKVSLSLHATGEPKRNCAYGQNHSHFLLVYIYIRSTPARRPCGIGTRKACRSPSPKEGPTT